MHVTSDLNHCGKVKPISQMFPVGDVPQLIRHDTGFANVSLYVAVRVAVYPEVNATVGNKVAKFHGECTVNRAIPEFLGGAQLRGHVMSEHNFCFCSASRNRPFDECKTTLVLTVEE